VGIEVEGRGKRAEGRRGKTRKGHTEELMISGIYRLVDSVDQTREIDWYNHQKGNYRSPVDSSFIPINTFILVQHGNM
jgi:hypothetical protein